MTYLDAHTHLDHCLPEDGRALRDVAPLVKAATDAGVTTIVNSGTDVGSSLWAVAVASAFPTVWATVGFHPHDAKRVHEDALAAIAALTAHPRVIAVGEVGLDYHYDHSPRDVQREVFHWHLELARDADLPVVIHTREADEHTLDLLAEHASGLTVVLHCFSMPERLDEVVRRGYYVSFAGNVTYKKAEALRTAAVALPDDLLLVETDAPYLTPEPYRDRPNTPARVVHTYEALAAERSTSPESLAAQVVANAARAFPRLRPVELPPAKGARPGGEERSWESGLRDGGPPAGPRRVGIFFGSTSYATAGVAQLVQEAFGSGVADLSDVAGARAEDLAPYDLLVFGTSTWGLGGLQHDWDSFIRELDRVDLTGRLAAVFASGDQVTWSATFVNSMGTLYDKLVERGARLIGSWPVEGYRFDESRAVRDGRFVGLPLDRVNQRDLTEGRVRAWVAQLRRESGL